MSVCSMRKRPIRHHRKIINTHLVIKANHLKGLSLTLSLSLSFECCDISQTRFKLVKIHCIIIMADRASKGTIFAWLFAAVSFILILLCHSHELLIFNFAQKKKTSLLALVMQLNEAVRREKSEIENT